MLNKRTTHQLAGNGEPVKVFELCKVHKCQDRFVGGENALLFTQFPISIFFLELTKKENWRWIESSDPRSFLGSRPTPGKTCPTQNRNQHTPQILSFEPSRTHCVYQSHSQFMERNLDLLIQLQETLDSQICILSEENLHKCDFF